MTDTESTNWFCGIDPGFKGAIGLISDKGEVLVWEMPVIDGKRQELNRLDLQAIMDHVQTFSPQIGLEWPSMRPGEGAQSGLRFGQQLGMIECLCQMKSDRYRRISPMKWKARLGLPGKEIPGANKTCAAYFDRFYSKYSSLIRGPRGGVLDGRMDALLIAHYLLMESGHGVTSMRTRFGKDSDELFAAVFATGKKKQGICQGQIRGV